MHGITLHDYHGIITCWKVLKFCMLKEAGRLSMEYNIQFILERLHGYTDNWKELDRIVRLQL